MDIDVKNALDKVLAICESIEKYSGENAKDVLAKDIFAFIKYISFCNVNERFNYFSKLYLKGVYSCEQYLNEPVSTEPEILKSFLTIDAQNKNGHVKASQILTIFFTALGKSYMSRSIDRKNIDVSRFADYLKKISAYTESNTNNTVLKPKSPYSHNVEKETSISESNSEPAESNEVAAEPEEHLEELLDKLNSLIGLDGVKKEVH